MTISKAKMITQHPSATAAYNLLPNWKQDPRNLIHTSGPVNDGVSFTNVDGEHGEQDIALASSGNTKSGRNKLAHITCHKCGKQGHFADKCEEEQRQEHQTGSMLLTAGIENGEFNHDVHFQFLQHTKEVSLKLDESGKIPKSWILLNNQSTVDVFYNANLLRNIRKVEKHMDIHCNAGVTSTNLVGDLPGYGTVWYHPNGIANILSLAKMQEHGYHIKYDSKDGNAFIIHKPDRSMRVFKQSDCGLYFMDSKTASAHYRCHTG